MLIHKHYYGARPDSIDIVSALRAVRNLRKVYLDILSKATPGTGIWLFKIDQWLLWLDANGKINILWGTGIRECLFQTLNSWEEGLMPCQLALGKAF